MHSKIKTYSKGMKQRLGIAQSLLHDPEVIFLDEPTDGVDPLGRREIRELMGRLKEKGHTIFLNSHLLGEVELICDRVAILQQGELVREGTIAELTEAEGAVRDRARARAAVPRGEAERARVTRRETAAATDQGATRADVWEVGLTDGQTIDPLVRLVFDKGLQPAAPGREEAVAGRRVHGDGGGGGAGRGPEASGKATAVGGSDR